jgi:hypothetical protein
MASTSRFEILNTIASGDFATVYRARDRELGREVAIKQIHPQFLSDPRQLERYWREAQLLASLQHPAVVTIHDVVRSQGWLILELLRGNMQQVTQTAPLDLGLLRILLVRCLAGLEFLHSNGIIHGDVKPSNLFVDAQGRIKLGDFGLARRVSDEQGSLLKGTTKYMAPELISDQFGPVGPASDLYSLGFSAYELMCGPQFEGLFPGLHGLGQDRQAAWLMWHAAADRRLPEISRVWEGVPEDLARTIERLTAKDPAERYQTAQEALEDLRSGEGASSSAGTQPAAEVLPPRKGKTRRRAALLSALASSALLVAWLLWPPPQAPVATAEPQAIAGVLRMIDPDRRILVLDLPGGDPLELQDLKPDDRFFVNEKRALLGELQRQDQVSIQYVHGEDGRRIVEVYATRPQIAEGKIKSVDAEAGSVVVALVSGGQELSVRVPGTVKILLNGQEDLQGQPVTLADLRAGDQVTVRHAAEQSGRAAVALAARRLVELAGVIRGVDLQNQTLTLETGEGKQVTMRQLALAPGCRLRLNSSETLDGRVLALSDLKPGDQATVAQDVRVVSIDAVRVVKEPGVIQSVQSQMLAVKIEGQPQPRSFLVDAACQVTLAGEAAELGDLRQSDLVEMSHDAPSPRTPNPRALAIAARRPEDRSRWAIVIGVQNYDDAALGAVPTATADAQLVRDALVKRHAVPHDQVLALTDPSRVRLEQGIASLLQRVQAAEQLIVYYAGRALPDAEGKVYLAPKEFNREQPPATGLSLQGLVDQLEACQAREKLLLWDACQAGPNAASQGEPSSADTLQTLGLPMRTVTAIASCSEGQRGQLRADRKAGLFAAAVAEGFSGRADKNRDGRLETTELLAYLNASMAAARPAQAQTARLFLPNDKPPRLSEEAQQAIRALAALARRSDVSPGKARTEFNAAQEAAGKEPEPKLLYGLVLLRAREWADAQRQFEDLRAANPELTLPLQGLVWTQFGRRDYADGVRDLVELVRKMKKPTKPGEALSAEARQLFSWAGQLREFAGGADEKGGVPHELLQRLDAAVAAHGAAAGPLYQEGRDATQAVFQDFETRIASTDDAATKAKTQIDRRNIRNYAEFPFDAALQSVLSQLDQ